MRRVKADIRIIGINPFVFLPNKVLDGLFEDHGKNKGPIPVKGAVNGKAFQQTLVKYSGAWRLYINTKMLPDSPKRIGEVIEICIEYDPSDRSISIPPELIRALKGNAKASASFKALTPSRQKEIVRYIAALKTEDSRARNVERAILLLLGKGPFVGQRPRN